MGSSGGQQPVVQQTQNTTPWPGAIPALQQAIGGATNLYNADVGYQPWPNASMAPLDPATQFGLGGMYTKASADYGGPESINAGLSQATNVINNQGLTSGQQNYVIPQMQAMASQFSQLYGTEGGVFNEASGTQNPYLLSQLAAQDRRIGDRINSSMSGAGRYGSGAHTDLMAKTLAEASYPVLAQDYSQRQQTKLAALNAMQAATAGGQGVQGSLSDLYRQGLETAGKYAQLAPGLEQAKYAPYDRLMSYGQYYQDRAQKDLENTINLYNATQARPWEQVARLNAIPAGAGQLGGTKVSTTTQPSVPTSNKIFGGALAGAGLGSTFGLPGAGLGALGGGLLGLMG